MDEPTVSRRGVLRTGGTLAGLATLGSLAGCSTLQDDGGDDGTPTESGPPPGRLGVVPDTAVAVVHADVAALLDSDDVTSTVDDLLTASAARMEATSLADLLDRVETQMGLDPRGVTELVGFAGLDDRLAGGVVWTD